MLPPVEDEDPAARPLWLVCEDGTEYLERFERFLPGKFRFRPARSAGALLLELAGLADAGAAGVGVILDLDFRRTPRELLIDEEGRTDAALSEERRRRLSESQGILILRLLRARGVTLPVLLFADLEDPGQAAYLEHTCAPLYIVPSNEGLRTTAARMEGLSQAPVR